MKKIKLQGRWKKINNSFLLILNDRKRTFKWIYFNLQMNCHLVSRRQDIRIIRNDHCIRQSAIIYFLFNIRFYYSRICRHRNNFSQIKFIFLFLQHQVTWRCVHVLMLLLLNNIKTDFCYSIRHIITHWINYPTQAIRIHNSILCLSLVISMEHILSITILRFTIS